MCVVCCGVFVTAGTKGKADLGSPLAVVAFLFVFIGKPLELELNRGCTQMQQGLDPSCPCRHAPGAMMGGRMLRAEDDLSGPGGPWSAF